MMSLAISLIGTASAGALLGVAGTLALAARRQADTAQMLTQVRSIRSDVAELGLLYARPSGPIRDDQPRAAVTRMVS